MDDELQAAGRRSTSGRGAGGDPQAVLRLHHGSDLIEAIPYLIGFRPRDSVVLVGIEGGPGDTVGAGGRVRITVRMDIADLCTPAGNSGSSPPDTARIRDGHLADLLDDLADPDDGARPYDGAWVDDGARPYDGAWVDDDAASVEEGALRAASAIRRSGATGVLGVVFADTATALALAGEAANRAGQACARAGLEVGDPIVVTAPGLDGPDSGIDRGGSRARHQGTSRVAAEATYAGLVALGDRQDVVELLAPEQATHRGRLRPALDAEQRLVSGGGAEGHRRRRSAIRALFAATRTLAVVEDATLVRFGAALRAIEVRDACWLAVEAGRLDGEALWRELARRLPAPYDAAPLFLFGWQRWRNGDGVLAAVAARRALDSDTGYTAAGLLHLAVTDGLDPFRTPRLRKGA